MTTSKKKPNQRGRDASTGKFIPISKAKKRPKTTVVETIKRTKKKTCQ